MCSQVNIFHRFATMVRPPRSFAGLAVVALSVFASDGLAQVPSATPVAPLSFGVHAGVNVARISGDNTGGLDNRIGVLVGGFATYRFSRLLAVQPELSYVQRGATGALIDEDGTSDDELNLDYLEVPLLLRVGPSAAAGVRPFLLAGPAIALNVSCEFSGVAEGGSGTLDCDDVPDLNLSSVDVSGVFGGGVEFPIASRSVSVGVRYAVGFRDIFEDVSGKNRSLAVTAGIRF